MTKAYMSIQTNTYQSLTEKLVVVHHEGQRDVRGRHGGRDVIIDAHHELISPAERDGGVHDHLDGVHEHCDVGHGCAELGVSTNEGSSRHNDYTPCVCLRRKIAQPTQPRGRPATRRRRTQGQPYFAAAAGTMSWLPRSPAEAFHPLAQEHAS